VSKQTEKFTQGEEVKKRCPTAAAERCDCSSRVLEHRYPFPIAKPGLQWIAFLATYPNHISSNISQYNNFAVRAAITNVICNRM